MSVDHLSSGLFAIAEEVGISLRLGADQPLTDQQYEAFCERYHTWAQQRDVHLKQHLARTSQAFRTLVPLTPRAFDLVYQVQWYFDEILIRDPIGRLVEEEVKESHLEQRKARLRREIQAMAAFRPALDAGSLVLYGKGAREQPPDLDREQLEDLARRPEIANALMEAVRWGLEVRAADDGREWHVYQMDLDTVHGYGWRIAGPLKEGAPSPAVRVGEQLTQATREEVEHIVGPRAIERARGNFPLEIEATLQGFALANSMSAVPLFDRNADGVIIQTALNIPESAFAQVGALNLTLPYLEGVSPRALLKLRQDDPEAFAEFRLLMNDLVRRAQCGALSEPLDRVAAREILPELRRLKAEFRALTRTRRYAGALGLASLAAGVLAGTLLAPLGGILATPAVPAAQIFLSSFVKEGPLTGNPFYWLWKARQ